MTVLFDKDFTEGYLAPGVFDHIFFNGKELEPDLAYGSIYGSSYGMKFTPELNKKATIAMYTTQPAIFKQGFYIHPGTIAIADPTKPIVISRQAHSDLSLSRFLINLKLITGQYGISAAVQKYDTGPSDAHYYSGDFILDNQAGWNLITIELFRDVAGYLKLWLNGVLKWTRTVDNHGYYLLAPCICSYTTGAVTGSFAIARWKAIDDAGDLGLAVPPPPPPPPFSLDISFEDGTKNELSSQVNPTKLVVSAAAAMRGGANGLAITIDGSGVAYGIKNGLRSGTGTYGVRIYFDPNTLTMASGDAFKIFRMANLDNSEMANLQLSKSGASYQITAGFIYDDGASNYSAPATISDGPHYIELYLTRSTDETSMDATAGWKLDGVAKPGYSGKDAWDNWNHWDRVDMGAIFGLDAGTSGEIWIDAIYGDEDGAVIGA